MGIDKVEEVVEEKVNLQVYDKYAGKSLASTPSGRPC